MRKILFATSILFLIIHMAPTARAQKSNAHYLQNRTPLVQKPFLELPLGTIKPKGWLHDQLIRMKIGMTGHLDELYPEVVGPRNGWLGGDGDGWERGPYWIDGLLPLAYILDDVELKEKVRPWIEWTLTNQMESGYLGPVPFEVPPDPEPGLQRGNREDWWPKMVMLKILQQYYSATGDERVIDCLTKYFRYQLKELPNTPLDHLTLWANRRGGDNLMIVYWLYNITGDRFLLELGDIIAEQTFPWREIFLNEANYEQFTTPWHYAAVKRYPFDPDEIKAITVAKMGSMHCVNFAQGLKEPVIRYQYTKDSLGIYAVKKALWDMEKYHGQPQGMYGGDEPLHGKNPVQGVEFCSVAEEMFSLESMTTITGDMTFVDQLEKIVYNALPAQANDDFTSRQYFQAANQIELSDRLNTSYQTIVHHGTDFVFGLLSGYPCCTTNMHQSWPKFVQNLFYATHDRGVAALSYAPSEVNVQVGNDTKLTIVEETGYPFRDEVRFSFSLDKSDQFPFVLRIPQWCQTPEIEINGGEWSYDVVDQKVILDRIWNDGDEIVLRLPMELKSSLWYDFAVAIERGPLVYALKIEHEEKKKDRGDKYGAFSEIYPRSEWRYGLLKKVIDDLDEQVSIKHNEWNGSYPWNLVNAPIELQMQGVHIPDWPTAHGAPVLPAAWGRSRPDKDLSLRNITLVPYGCTTLRITEFPVYEF